MKNLILLLALALLLSALPCLAEAMISPNDDYYCYDEADALSRDLEGEIYFSNQLLCESCGAQIVVVAVNTTGDKGIGEYAAELFDAWEIGGDGDNGFLLLLAIRDGDYFARPGAGLAERLSEEKLAALLSEYLEGDFAEGRYNQGVMRFYEALFPLVAEACDSDVALKDGIKAYMAYRLQSGCQTCY